MYEGRERSEWVRLSQLLALLATVHRDPKKRKQPYSPADFNPYAEQRKPHTSLTVDRLLVMRGMFQQNSENKP